MIKKPLYPISDRHEMLRFIPFEPKKSLEVGCREALFSKRLKEKFKKIETWGIEPDGSTIRRAEQNLDKAICGLFPEQIITLPRIYFDLIIFNDVLEHMYDPWDALEMCHSILKPEGIIIASIPNIRHKSILRELILHDQFEYQEAGNLDITHIRFFTKKTMIKLFTYTGYQVLRVEPVIPIQSTFKKLIISLSFKNLESFYVPQYAIVARNKKNFNRQPP